jgi:hypothetical protein
MTKDEFWRNLCSIVDSTRISSIDLEMLSLYRLNVLLRTQHNYNTAPNSLDEVLELIDVMGCLRILTASDIYVKRMEAKSLWTND